MKHKIKLIYVDDKLDPLLVEYLYDFRKDDTIIAYNEIEFDSSSRDYESLLTDNRVLESDIIVIDSKLFENEYAESGSKFTGQEFKLVLRILNPFIKVIVITQNKNLENYGVLNKFATSKVKGSQENANDFYNKSLKPAMEEAIKEIVEMRRIGKELELNKGAYEGSLIVEKTQNLLNKITSYRELTDEKIDELIDIIKQEEPNVKKIIQEKNLLAKKIDKRTIKDDNRGKHYDKIKNKCSNYYETFQEIYHQKCGYCGVSVSINSAPQYELDHFINELQKTSPNGKSVDHIENLIFACRNCNQAKKEFDTKKIIGIVHPDGENIKKVFERDNYYKIVISQEYLNNEEVKSFYSKMKFDYAYRKLDYLLLNLYFTKNNKKDRIYNRLLELRNSFPSLNKLQ